MYFPFFILHRRAKRSTAKAETELFRASLSYATEKPHHVLSGGVFPLERREVEKRIYVEKEAAHGFRCLSWI